MKKYLIGIDIGGTSIKIGLFNLEGILLEKWAIPSNKTENGNHILTEIAQAIEKKYNLEEVNGIGFGVPGPVQNNKVIHCVNLGWKEVDVTSEFSKHLKKAYSLRIKVANDANLAAAGERFQGIAKGYDNVCMFTLGTGIGSGIIINGSIVEGYNGFAGELGHMVIDSTNQILCNCGKQGCLETVASATGIVSLAQIHLANSLEDSLLRFVKKLSAKKVIDFAKMGDILANRIADESMDYLAYAMALITYVIDPGIFVIGGGVSNAGDFLIQKIEQHYYKYVKPFILHTTFKIATLGNDAGIYGAAYMVKE
ncbi:MAG: ROK family glucokinase [Firmicutes bacterium]|nr:ROK family glucokinase [Bacillota bacterium]